MCLPTGISEQMRPRREKRRGSSQRNCCRNTKQCMTSLRLHARVASVAVSNVFDTNANVRAEFCGCSACQRCPPYTSPATRHYRPCRRLSRRHGLSISCQQPVEGCVSLEQQPSDMIRNVHVYTICSCYSLSSSSHRHPNIANTCHTLDCFRCDF